MSTTTLHIPAREVLPGDEVTVTLKVTSSREWDHMLWNIADATAGFGVVVAPDAILTVRREDPDADYYGNPGMTEPDLVYCENCRSLEWQEGIHGEAPEHMGSLYPCPTRIAADAIVAAVKRGEMTTTDHLTEKLAALKIGDRFTITPAGTYAKRSWRVGARNDRYIVAHRGRTERSIQYTVIDMEFPYQYNGVGPGVIRSSLNLIGGGYDIGPDGSGCQGALEGLLTGSRELSHRRLLYVDDITLRDARGER